MSVNIRAYRGQHSSPGHNRPPALRVGNQGIEGKHPRHAARYGRCILRFTEEQWNALCVLRHIGGAKRQASPTTRALRAVLVDGTPPLEAAERHGLTHQCVYNAMSRSRNVQALARELAGAVDI